MKRLAATLAVVTTALAAGAPLARNARAQELSAEGRRIVDYLLDDWAEHMHSTSIPRAMENLGIPADDELRLEVGAHLRDNTDLADNLKWWGANNYILGNEEKRLAKQIVNTYDAEERLPDVAELASVLGAPAGAIRSRLDFLAKAGLLVPDGSTALGYRLIDKYGRWGGPLRFNYHTITIGDGKPFDVW